MNVFLSHRIGCIACCSLLFLTIALTASPVFLLDFEDGFVARSDGPAEPLQSTIDLKEVEGVSGMGVRLGSGAFLKYTSVGNLKKERGTLAFWFRLDPDRVDAGGRIWTFFCESGPDDAGANRMTVEFFPGRFIRAGIRDPRNIHLYYHGIEGWTRGAWQHLALTWDAAKGASLYINGQLVSVGWMPTWDPVDSEAFYLGAADGEGAQAAPIDMDDFRVYDRELSEAELRGLYEAHRSMPVDVIFVDPFVRAGSGSEVEVVFRNPASRSAEIEKMSYELLDSSGALVAAEELENLRIDALAKARIGFELPELQTGDYRLNLDYRLHGETARSSQPLMAVGRSEGPGPASEGRRLLIDVVDAVSDEPIAEAGGTSIRSLGERSYREAGSNFQDRFALDFKVDNLAQPHLVVIHIPDDKRRSMEIMLQHFDATRDFQVHAGVFTGEEYPNSGEMMEYHVLFWPRTERQALVFMTMEDGYPAAVERLEVYRLDEFPVASQEGRFEGGTAARSIGLYYEDPVLFHSFGTSRSRESFILATERLIEYMHSLGQTEFEYPLAWYAGPIYGTTVEPFEPDIIGAQGGQRPHPNGFPAYLMKRFADEGIRFVAGLHLHTLPSLNRYALTDWNRIHGGEETIININKDGALWYGHWHGRDPNYNPLDPRVQAAAASIVEEVATRYADEPAFEGISLVMAKPKLFTFGSIESGYNDSNLVAFQCDSGVSIPVYEAGDPERFRRSYDWLMSNVDAREAWITWRCEQLYIHYSRMADRLAEIRPDLTLKLNIFVHPRDNPRQANYLDTPAIEVMREFGIDPRLYKEHENIVLNHTMVPAEMRWARNNIPLERNEVYRTAMTSAEVVKAYQTAGRTRVTIHDRYWEDAIGREEPLRGLTDLGVPEMVWRASTLNAPDFHSLESYMLAVHHLDAQSIVKGGYVIGTFGMEQVLEPFTRAFQALPAVRFDDVDGGVDPVRVRQRELDGRRYFYVLNTLPVELKAELGFDREVGFLELVSGRNTEPTDLFELELKPYELRSFVTDSESAAINQVDADVPEVWLSALENRLQDLFEAAGRNLETAGHYKAYLDLMRRSWDNGHVSKVYFLLQEHWVSEVLEGQLD